MTGTKSREYRQLEQESSNQLMEHDSRRVLGRYEEAAYRALQAGQDRARMGQLCCEAGEYAEAAEDWLSATACFLLATAPKQAVGALGLLRRLEAEGKVPAERPDLRNALREREQQLNDLNRQVEQFLHGFEQPGKADERTLGSLLRQVRDLPGLPALHYAIYRQASELGQQALADKHRVWAGTFDSESVNGVAVRVPPA
jgi:hypothetical protein